MASTATTTRRRRALLAGVAERALDDGRHRLVEVGVGVDDDRVLAAHLGDDALDVALPGPHLGGPLDDVEPDRLRAGERDERDIGMLDERGPDLLADTRQEREHAVGQPGVEQHLDQPRRDARRLLGRLEHDGVAGHELPPSPCPSGWRAGSSRAR